jgi:hypothetical protein
MELGRAARLLQSRLLGRLVESLSSSSLLLPPASGSLCEPSGLSRQLGLSPTPLSSAVSSIAASGSPSDSTSGSGSSRNSAACESRHSGAETGETGNTESAGAADEAGYTNYAGNETGHETLATRSRESVNSTGQAGKSRFAIDETDAARSWQSVRATRQARLTVDEASETWFRRQSCSATQQARGHHEARNQTSEANSGRAAEQAGKPECTGHQACQTDAKCAVRTTSQTREPERACNQTDKASTQRSGRAARQACDAEPAGSESTRCTATSEANSVQPASSPKGHAAGRQAAAEQNSVGKN